MCGIAATINGLKDETMLMGQSISKRGKSQHYFEVDNIKVSFAYLPIVNQSAPPQPAISGEWFVWLNGYISNYLELADKYNISLQYDSDTLLVAEYFGLHGFNCNEFNGFFSILAYNRLTKKVYTITDRYGIKQLYQYQESDTMYICSEVKGLLSVKHLDIDYDALDDWMYSLGVMTDHTIYDDVYRVGRVPMIIPDQIVIDYSEAKEILSAKLLQSIKRNKSKVSDCVFLSGGVDSGILAKGMMPDYCFSVDYTDDHFSEITNIKLNSQAVHMTLICNDNLYRSYRAQTAYALDDPKAGSCYTNFALTHLASKFCTVVYSGAGADEIFDGYTHRYDKNINDVIRRTPIKGREYSISHKEYDWRFLRAILVVEDRMTGHHAMESRYPYLDNDFVNFALSLPCEYRQNKQILKDISGLPEIITKSKKRGFSNPISNYEWAQYISSQQQNTSYRNNI